MKQPIRVGLVGIAGYGEFYLNALLDDPRDAAIELIGVADPAAERSTRLSDLNRRGIAVHRSMDALLAVSDLDFLCLSTPLQLHAEQIEVALDRGLSVLCEKPLAATIEQARQIFRAEARAKKRYSNAFVGIGFQWCFSDAITEFKRDVAAGMLGRPIRLKAIALYPRAASYFNRNGWAGRKFTSGGEAVFDSPLNNATSHFLHAMFYILGERPNSSAMPVELSSEVYRANRIETFDCAALRARTEAGIEILFYTAHCIAGQHGPAFSYEFEHASVEYSAGGDVIAQFNDGRTKNYGNPSVDPMRKIFACVEALREQKSVPCGIEACLPHARCVSAAFGPDTIAPEIPFDRWHWIESKDSSMLCVDGLDEALIDCYRRNVLPSESDDRRLDWSQPAHCVSLLSHPVVPQAKTLKSPVLI